MPYYLRLFAPGPGLPSLDELRREFENEVRISVDEGSEQDWSAILVSSAETDICRIERAVAGQDGIAAEEIEEFRNEMSNAVPSRGAAWVRDYLTTVQAVYACQYLSGAFESRFDRVPANVLWVVKAHVGGIIQGDHEGFSNADGYTVVWDFSDRATGPWKMAVLDEAGSWTAFEMELGDRGQREAFLAGGVPRDARLL